jgi:hypothetical protein
MDAFLRFRHSTVLEVEVLLLTTTVRFYYCLITFLFDGERRDGSLTAGHGFTNSCFDELYEYCGVICCLLHQIFAFRGVGGRVPMTSLCI